MTQTPQPAVAREAPADHTECEYERALGRMRSHDPAGIVWLVEQLTGWEIDVEARRAKRLQEPNREQARRRYEEKFERRLELVRREPQ